MRFRPLHGFLALLVFSALVILASLASDGRLGASPFERVRRGDDGLVRVPIGDLAPQQVRFFRYLSASNQEIRFFIGRSGEGDLAVAFHANEVCAKSRRGYRAEGDWVTCNKCDKAFRLDGVAAGGDGCSPVPIRHRREGESVVFAEDDLLIGWRLFT